MGISGFTGASDGSVECIVDSLDSMEGSGDDLEYRIQWLRSFPPFSSLRDAALRDLALSMLPRAVRPGDILQEAGVNVNEVIVLRYGAADVSNEKPGTQGEPGEAHAHCKRTA